MSKYLQTSTFCIYNRLLRIATSAILLQVSFPSWIGSGEEMSAFGLCEI